MTPVIEVVHGKVGKVPAPVREASASQEQDEEQDESDALHPRPPRAPTPTNTEGDWGGTRRHLPVYSWGGGGVAPGGLPGSLLPSGGGLGGSGDGGNVSSSSGDRSEVDGQPDSPPAGARALRMGEDIANENRSIRWRLQQQRMHSERRYADRVAQKRRRRGKSVGVFVRQAEARAAEVASLSLGHIQEEALPPDHRSLQPVPEEAVGTAPRELTTTLYRQANLDIESHNKQRMAKRVTSDRLYAPKIAARRRARGLSVGQWARRTNAEFLESSGMVESRSVFLARTGQLLLLGLLPIGIFGLLFTQMGYGATVFLALHKAGQNMSLSLPLNAILALLFVAYLYDISYWYGCLGNFMRGVFILVCISMVLMGSALAFANYPYMPLMTFHCLVVAFYWVLRRHLFNKCHHANYIMSVGWVLVIQGCGCMVAVSVWAAMNSYFWGDATQQAFKSALTVGINTSSPMNSVCLAACGPHAAVPADSCVQVQACVDIWTSDKCIAANSVGSACQSHACQAAMVKDPSAHCLAAFLLYCSQFVAACSCIGFGSVAVMLSRTVRWAGAKRLQPVISAWGTIAMGVVCSFWVAASIAGASMQLSNMVTAMGLLLLIMSVVLMGATIGWSSLDKEVHKLAMVKMLERSRNAVIIKSMLILLCGPIIPLYFAMSVLNQFFRKNLPFTKMLEEQPSDLAEGNRVWVLPEQQSGKLQRAVLGSCVREGSEIWSLTYVGRNNVQSLVAEVPANRLRKDDAGRPVPVESDLWLTKVGHNQWTVMARWPWTRVLQGVVNLGFIYFVVAVGGAKITTMFLAWLNFKLAPVSLAVTTATYVGVGLVMFLLPPVPGVPVYLTGGIILTGSAEAAFRPSDDPAGSAGQGQMSDDISYFCMACAYACAFSMLTKLLAIATQQKMIGGLLGSKVAVRSMVGVNSATVRAIKIILQDPAWLSRGKVAILVGGPDWPTSVTTGILGLPLLPMLVGSLPLVFPLSLTTLAGSMMLKVSSGGRWSSIASMALTLAVAAQTLCLLMAGMEVQKAREKNLSKIQAMEVDEEVAAKDAKVQRFQESMYKVTDWKRLPFLWKVVLVGAAFCAQVSFIMLATLGTQCFQDVQVTTVLAEPPISDNWLNLIKRPMGYIAVGLQLVCLILYKLFSWWGHLQYISHMKIASTFYVACTDLTTGQSINRMEVERWNLRQSKRFLCDALHIQLRKSARLGSERVTQSDGSPLSINAGAELTIIDQKIVRKQCCGSGAVQYHIAVGDRDSKDSVQGWISATYYIPDSDGIPRYRLDVKEKPRRRWPALPSLSQRLHLASKQLAAGHLEKAGVEKSVRPQEVPIFSIAILGLASVLVAVLCISTVSWRSAVVWTIAGAVTAAIVCFCCCRIKTRQTCLCSVKSLCALLAAYRPGSGKRDRTNSDRVGLLRGVMVWFTLCVHLLVPVSLMAQSSSDGYLAAWGVGIFSFTQWLMGWAYLAWNLNSNEMAPLHPEQRIKETPGKWFSLPPHSVKLKVLVVIYEVINYVAIAYQPAIPWSTMRTSFWGAEIDVQKWILASVFGIESGSKGMHSLNQVLNGSVSASNSSSAGSWLTSEHTVAATAGTPSSPVLLVVACCLVLFSVLLLLLNSRRKNQHYHVLIINIFFDLLTFPMFCKLNSAFACTSADILSFDNGASISTNYTRVCDLPNLSQDDARQCMDALPHVQCWTAEHMNYYVLPVIFGSTLYYLAVLHLQTKSSMQQSIVIMDGCSRVFSVQGKLLLAVVSIGFGRCYPGIIIATLQLTIIAQVWLQVFGGSCYKAEEELVVHDMKEDVVFYSNARSDAHNKPYCIFAPSVHKIAKNKKVQLIDEPRVDKDGCHFLHIKWCELCNGKHCNHQHKSQLPPQMRLIQGWVRKTDGSKLLVTLARNNGPRDYSTVLSVNILRLVGMVLAGVNGLVAGWLTLHNTLTGFQSACSREESDIALNTPGAQLPNSISIQRYTSSSGSWTEAHTYDNEFSSEERYCNCTGEVRRTTQCMDLCNKPLSLGGWICINCVVIAFGIFYYNIQYKKNGAEAWDFSPFAAVIGADTEATEDGKISQLRRHISALASINTPNVAQHVNFPIVQRRIKALQQIAKQLRCIPSLQKPNKLSKHFENFFYESPMDLNVSAGIDGQEIETATIDMVLDATAFTTRELDEDHNNFLSAPSNGLCQRLMNMYRCSNKDCNDCFEIYFRNSSRRIRKNMRPQDAAPFQGLRVNLVGVDSRREGGYRTLQTLRSIHRRAQHLGCNVFYIDTSFPFLHVGRLLANARVTAVRLHGKMSVTEFDYYGETIISKHLGIDTLDLSGLTIDRDSFVRGRGCWARFKRRLRGLSNSGTLSLADLLEQPLRGSQIDTIDISNCDISREDVERFVQLARWSGPVKKATPPLCTMCRERPATHGVTSNRYGTVPVAHWCSECAPTGHRDGACIEIREPERIRPIKRLTIDSTGMVEPQTGSCLCGHSSVLQDPYIPSHGEQPRRRCQCRRQYTLDKDLSKLDLSHKNLGEMDVLLLNSWLERWVTFMRYSLKPLTELDVGHNSTLGSAGKQALAMTMKLAGLQIHHLTIDLGGIVRTLHARDEQLDLSFRPAQTRAAGALQPDDVFFVASWLLGTHVNARILNLSGNFVFGSTAATDGDVDSHNYANPNQDGWEQVCLTLAKNYKLKKVSLANIGLQPESLKRLASALRGVQASGPESMGTTDARMHFGILASGIVDLNISQNFLFGYKQDMITGPYHTFDERQDGWKCLCDSLCESRVEMLAASDVGMGPQGWATLANALQVRAKQANEDLSLEQWLLSLTIQTTPKDRQRLEALRLFAGRQQLEALNILEPLLVRPHGFTRQKVSDLMGEFKRQGVCQVSDLESIVTGDRQLIRSRSMMIAMNDIYAGEADDADDDGDMLMDLCAEMHLDVTFDEYCVLRDGLEQRLMAKESAGSAVLIPPLAMVDVLTNKLWCLNQVLGDQKPPKWTDLCTIPDVLSLCGIHGAVRTQAGAAFASAHDKPVAVEIVSCRLQEDDCVLLAQDIERLVGKYDSTTVKIVDLSHNQLVASSTDEMLLTRSATNANHCFIRLLAALRRMELEELRLENIGLNPTTLAQLESDTSTVDQTKGLTDLFHTEGCPMRKVLKVLNLAGNFLTGSYSSVASGGSGWMFDADCRPLLGLGHALPDTVQRLDLHGCHLGSNAAKTISQWPQLPSLRSLDLSGDNDGGLVGRQEEPDRYLEEWRELCGWLGQQPVINKLSLATNGIGPKALNVFVNHALGRNLRTLSLRGNPLCAGPDAQLDSWAQLCATIARLPLVTLDVADIAPGANDQQRVALLSSLTAALSGDNDSTLYKTLCELDVSSNGLGSAWHSQGDTTAAELVTTEWESFGAALQRCTKLRALRLSSNDIHAFAIRHLMLPSSMNDSAYGLPCFVEALTDLDLGCNPLECGGKLALARVLAQGKLHKLTVHMGASHLVTLEASMTVLDLSSRGLRGVAGDLELLTGWLQISTVRANLRRLDLCDNPHLVFATVGDVEAREQQLHRVPRQHQSSLRQLCLQNSREHEPWLSLLHKLCFHDDDPDLFSRDDYAGGGSASYGLGGKSWSAWAQASLDTIRAHNDSVTLYAFLCWFGLEPLRRLLAVMQETSIAELRLARTGLLESEHDVTAASEKQLSAWTDAESGEFGLQVEQMLVQTLVIAGELRKTPVQRGLATRGTTRESGSGSGSSKRCEPTAFNGEDPPPLPEVLMEDPQMLEELHLELPAGSPGHLAVLRAQLDLLYKDEASFSDAEFKARRQQLEAQHKGRGGWRWVIDDPWATDIALEPIFWPADTSRSTGLVQEVLHILKTIGCPIGFRAEKEALEHAPYSRAANEDVHFRFVPHTKTHTLQTGDSTLQASLAVWQHYHRSTQQHIRIQGTTNTSQNPNSEKVVELP